MSLLKGADVVISLAQTQLVECVVDVGLVLDLDVVGQLVLAYKAEQVLQLDSEQLAVGPLLLLYCRCNEVFVAFGLLVHFCFK